jgi:hypothetical protein
VASEPRIRPARPDDAAGIAATLRDLGWFEQINTESVEATTQRVAEQLALCAANDDHTVLVAEGDDGKIAGYLAAHWFPNLMKGGYVSELFIREAPDTLPCDAARIQA